MKNISIGKSITNRKDDISLDLFLKEISKIPLLTAEEELEVARKAKAGDKKALDKLVTSNLRFVVSVAKQYQGQGLDLMDLIAEGSYGSIIAAKKFDPDKGFKFISYSVWWIRQSIVQALTDKTRTIRIPNNQLILLFKVKKMQSQLRAKTNKEPTHEEIADLLGISLEKVNNVLALSTKCQSVDTPFKDDEEGTLLDIIPNNTPKTDENISNEYRTKAINSLLNKIGDRNAAVIRMLYGLGMDAMSTEEIGHKLGITSERVRQIRNIVLKQFRTKYKKEVSELI